MSERMVIISEKEYNKLRVAKMEIDAIKNYVDVIDELSDSMSCYIEALKDEENWDALVVLTSWYNPDLHWINIKDIEDSFVNDGENQYDFSEDEFEILKAHYESLYH